MHAEISWFWESVIWRTRHHEYCVQFEHDQRPHTGNWMWRVCLIRYDRCSARSTAT
jgi:hypothetical protein